MSGALFFALESDSIESIFPRPNLPLFFLIYCYDSNPIVTKRVWIDEIS